MGRYSLLIIVAVLAVGAAVFVAKSRAPQTEAVGNELLLPGLRDALNDVTTITAVGPGEVVLLTLNKGDNDWGIAQRGGYRADTAKIRTFMLAVADAKLVERKTSNADNYPALGVEAISEATAGGVRVDLRGGVDASFIVGKVARGGTASYVRNHDQTTSWLANKDLSVDQSVASWLDKTLTDIAEQRIDSVRIVQPDGATLLANRGADNFEIADLAADQALSSASAADPLATVLEGLRFNDVLLATVFDPGDSQPVRSTYTTVGGLIVEANLYALEDKYFVSFASRFDADAVTLDMTSTAEESEDKPSQQAIDAAVAQASQSEADEINALVTGWVYEIGKAKFDLMSRQVKDLLAAE